MIIYPQKSTSLYKIQDSKNLSIIIIISNPPCIRHLISNALHSFFNFISLSLSSSFSTLFPSSGKYIHSREASRTELFQIPSPPGKKKEKKRKREREREIESCATKARKQTSEAGNEKRQLTLFPASTLRHNPSTLLGDGLTTAIFTLS